MLIHTKRERERKQVVEIYKKEEEIRSEDITHTRTHTHTYPHTHTDFNRRN